MPWIDYTASIQQIAQSVTPATIIFHLRPSYMFRPLQGHHNYSRE
jgi:hypothetical protein